MPTWEGAPVRGPSCDGGESRGSRDRGRCSLDRIMQPEDPMGKQMINRWWSSGLEAASLRLPVVSGWC